MSFSLVFADPLIKNCKIAFPDEKNPVQVMQYTLDRVKNAAHNKDVSDDIESWIPTYAGMLCVDLKEMGWSQSLSQALLYRGHLAQAKWDSERCYYMSSVQDPKDCIEKVNRHLKSLESLSTEIFKNFPSDNPLKKGSKIQVEQAESFLKEALKQTPKPRTPADCETVQFSEEFGPNREQSAGNCYAYAAADLLSFYYKKRISAQHLTVHFNLSDSKDLESLQQGKAYSELHGGYTKEAIEFGLKSGLCSEEDFPSEIHSSSSKPFEYYQYLKKAETQVGEIQNRWKNNPQSAHQLDSCEADLLKKFFPQASFEDLIDAVEKATSGRVLEVLNFKACQGKLIGFDPSQPIPQIRDQDWGSFRTLQDVDQAVQTIDAQLKAHRPVSLVYDFGDVDGTQDVQIHSSVIIGRQFDPKTKTCQYLIRNSHGNSCSLDKKYPYGKCDPVHPGNFWIDEAILRKSVTGVTYLE